jgi:hypothetical protein
VASPLPIICKIRHSVRGERGKAFSAFLSELNVTNIPPNGHVADCNGNKIDRPLFFHVDISPFLFYLVLHYEQKSLPSSHKMASKNYNVGVIGYGYVDSLLYVSKF